MRRQRPPVRHGECRSRPRPPFRKTGQLRQRRRHGRDASVNSPAAGVRPSLLGPRQLGDGDSSTLTLTLIPGASGAAATTPDLPVRRL